MLYEMIAKEVEAKNNRISKFAGKEIVYFLGWGEGKKAWVWTDHALFPQCY